MYRAFMSPIFLDLEHLWLHGPPQPSHTHKLLWKQLTNVVIAIGIGKLLKLFYFYMQKINYVNLEMGLNIKHFWYSSIEI